MNFRTKFSIAAIVVSVLYLVFKLASGGVIPKSSSGVAETMLTPEELVLDIKLKEFESNYSAEQACITEGVLTVPACEFKKLTTYVKPKGVIETSDNDNVSPEGKINLKEQVNSEVIFSSFLACAEGNCAVLNGVTIGVGKKVFGTPYTVTQINTNFVVLTAPDGHEYKIKFKQDIK